MATQHGASIIFGVGATSTMISGAIQSADQSSEAQKEAIRNGVGDTLTKVWYDITETKATFDYVATGSAITVPTIGTLGTIVDSTDTGMAGTTWTVDGWSKAKSNTAAVKVKLELSKNDNITS
jgi:hypothetical protein